jgi:hypothetical protein
LSKGFHCVEVHGSTYPLLVDALGHAKISSTPWVAGDLHIHLRVSATLPNTYQSFSSWLFLFSLRLPSISSLCRLISSRCCSSKTNCLSVSEEIGKGTTVIS